MSGRAKRRGNVSNTGRWTLAALVAVLALVVALWPRERSADVATGAGIAQITAPPAATAAVTAADRAAAELEPCPVPTGAAGTGPLTDVRLGCLADGGPVDLAGALAGRPAVLNLWAYWCAPCAEELPYLQQFAVRAGDAVTVLTVHSDPSEAAALNRLTELGVHLPGVQDSDATVRATVGAPAVLPLSVLLRSDGTVAEVVVRPFTGVDDIADTVARALGVAA
ncbi:MAG TPA: TlpA disulfide reductase family protein [Aldersonia sp.]